MDDIKKTQSVHFTSKSQTWNTPLHLFQPLNDIWQFTIDAACLEDSALCERFYTPETDGLLQDWSKEVVWLNPPYNDIKTWMKKCSDSHAAGATIVTLIPSRTDTKAFQDYIALNCTCICFIRGRLKFANPILEEDTEITVSHAPFPSCLVVFDNNLTQEKMDHLKSLGMVVTKVQ